MNDSNTDSPTIQIPLLHGHILILDEIDKPLLKFNWTAIPNHKSSTFYAQRYVHTPPDKRTSIHIHRMIMSLVLGRELKKHEHVDHENHNGLDNRRSNLRIATRSQNMGNRRLNADNTSGYKGVSLNRSSGKWRAAIGINGKTKHLGYYQTPEIAAAIYNQAALEHFGEFASLNTIED